MNLRPRYSLLMLLILTALIAGGTWYWFKPTRYRFDLTQAWDATADDQALEVVLRRAVSYSAAHAASRYAGSLVYDARRTLTGSPELLAAMFHWQQQPILARFTRPGVPHPEYLLTFSTESAFPQEVQHLAERYGAVLQARENAICWVSSQVKNFDSIQIELTGCGTGLCHVPVGPEPESRTSYLLTDRGTIYQLNRRRGHDEHADFRAVSLNQVAEPCRALLAEELSQLSP